MLFNKRQVKPVSRIARDFDVLARHYSVKLNFNG
jgi:hypothetical protein